MEIKIASVLPGIDEDRKDWLLCGGKSRDSEILEESNFAAIVKILGGESETMEIHRFRHWAVGWIKEILVHPARLSEVEIILDRLDSYPVLDEDDFSERESAAAFESWVSFGCKEFAKSLQHEFDLMDSTHDLLMKSPDWTLYTFENEKPYTLCTEGDSVVVRAYGGKTKLTRDQLAGILLKIRKQIRAFGG